MASSKRQSRSISFGDADQALLAELEARLAQGVASSFSELCKRALRQLVENAPAKNDSVENDWVENRRVKGAIPQNEPSPATIQPTVALFPDSYPGATPATADAFTTHTLTPDAFTQGVLALYLDLQRQTLDMQIKLAKLEAQAVEHRCDPLDLGVANRLTQDVAQLTHRVMVLEKQPTLITASLAGLSSDPPIAIDDLSWPLGPQANGSPKSQSLPAEDLDPLINHLSSLMEEF